MRYLFDCRRHYPNPHPELVEGRGIYLNVDAIISILILSLSKDEEYAP